jgi:hypothetical protein
MEDLRRIGGTCFFLGVALLLIGAPLTLFSDSGFYVASIGLLGVAFGCLTELIASE